MRILIPLLTLGVLWCSGFPVHDYDLPVAEEALNASLARINSRSWGPNLYGVVWSRVTRVDVWSSDAFRLELQLSIRETICTKASGRDPSTCDFKTGPFVPTSFCTSIVEVSGERISSVVMRCHRGTSSSESLSSEEVIPMPRMNPNRRGNSRREGVFTPEAFPSRGGGGSQGGSFGSDKAE